MTSWSWSDMLTDHWLEKWCKLLVESKMSLNHWRRRLMRSCILWHPCTISFLAIKWQSKPRQSQPVQTFLKHVQKYLDDKFWTSITTFPRDIRLSDTFIQFIPQITREDSDFKRRLMIDLDSWLLSEMEVVAERWHSNRLPMKICQGILLHVWMCVSVFVCLLPYSE